MNIPNISALVQYTGRLFNNNDWNANFTQIANWLSNGTADLVFNSFTVDTNSNMNGALINNLGTPLASTDAANKSYVDSATTPRGYIDGYTLSNDGTSPNTVIDITTGICQNSTNSQVITLYSAITKSIASNWASGTGSGGLDTGSVAASTWYYVFAIYNPVSNATDILFSTSATNPLLPSGFTVFRRIGSIKTDSSSHILPFVQKGDEFLWGTPVADVNTAMTTTQTLYTLSVPPVDCLANIYAELAPNGTNASYALILSPYVINTTPTSSLYNAHSYQYGGQYAFNDSYSGYILAKNGQIGGRVSAVTNLFILTLGYKDSRGKN